MRTTGGQAVGTAQLAVSACLDSEDGGARVQAARTGGEGPGRRGGGHPEADDEGGGILSGRRGRRLRRMAPGRPRTSRTAWTRPRATMSFPGRPARQRLQAEESADHQALALSPERLCQGVQRPWIDLHPAVSQVGGQGGHANHVECMDILCQLLPRVLKEKHQQDLCASEQQLLSRILVQVEDLLSKTFQGIKSLSEREASGLCSGHQLAPRDHFPLPVIQKALFLCSQLHDLLAPASQGKLEDHLRRCAPPVWPHP